MKPRVGRNPLLARLRALTVRLDAVPPGYKTCDQWAQAWGLSRPQAYRFLAAGLAAGLIVRKKFRVHAGRKVFRAPHYAARPAA